MPEKPNRAANFQGGSEEYWRGLLSAYEENGYDLGVSSDAMKVTFGGPEYVAPQPPRYMEGAHAVGAAIAGELIAA